MNAREELAQTDTEYELTKLIAATLAHVNETWAGYPFALQGALLGTDMTLAAKRVAAALSERVVLRDQLEQEGWLCKWEGNGRPCLCREPCVVDGVKQPRTAVYRVRTEGTTE